MIFCCLNSQFLMLCYSSPSKLTHPCTTIQWSFLVKENKNYFVPFNSPSLGEASWPPACCSGSDLILPLGGAPQGVTTLGETSASSLHQSVRNSSLVDCTTSFPMMMALYQQSNINIGLSIYRSLYTSYALNWWLTLGFSLEELRSAV